MYYQDLRAFLSALEERGLVHRFSEPINKDTELLPLYRLQMRGLPSAARRVMLFDHVVSATGNTYRMSVAAGVYGVSEEILTLGIGCQSPIEALEKWHQALENPVPPVVVESGPVQEEVHLGDELLSLGLDELPVPVEEPGFSQILRTGVPMITRDPDSGVRNMGTYNGFLRDRNRIVSGIAETHHATRYHWRSAKRRNEDLPIAIVLGATPNIMLAGSAEIPYGIDELAVAGGLAGEPVALVQCKTVPLEVPAHAEIVIEGMLSTRVFEPRLGFGEYPGYVNMSPEKRPVITITAITHRKHAWFTPVLVGFPPSDNTTLSAFCYAAMLYHQLRYLHGLPVEDVYFHEMAGGCDLGVIRVESGGGARASDILKAASGLSKLAKYLIVVDHDINPRDQDLLIWALSYRVRPERDLEILPGRVPALDPSAIKSVPAQDNGAPARQLDPHCRVLVDATMKGAYPPVALPRREHMERALELWHRHPGLPELQLRAPWYGYRLGSWSRRDQEIADLIAGGDYKAVGRITADLQRRDD